MLKRVLATGLFIASIFASARAAEPEVKPEDLPRVKPTEPADALKTFQVRKGFRIELVAAEPLVIDPIAMCFDENGRLFVLEMRDYSERRAEKLGRIRMLEDLDGDGKFDKTTVFLEGLPWPTAMCWWKGGILVGACPDIIYAKDTNGDGVADDVKTVFTGFGPTQERLNVQGLFNNFQWGIDNRIHGCSGLAGGMVTGISAPDAPPLDVRGKGIVIDPRTWTMTTENGGGQYGLSFDPTGRLFTCSNSSHIETFMYDARYAARNPNYTPPDARVAIAVDGPAAEVFRISPEEPWRVIRTRWRISGVVKGQIEGGGRSAGYFTGATGITIYRGNAYGPEYVGDAFVGDAGGNLVHHKRIRRSERDPLELLAERPADEKTLEFVASTDNWFRPVDFANAPDGTLYIADMYRETIEHPWSIPPNIKKYLDLNSGNDRGRIYRLVPDGYVQPKPPRLGNATTEELVTTLEHPNGWHRETASRLLFERQDKSAVPLLIALLEKSQSPLGRMHALHALEGLDGLSESAVIKGLDDPDANVRAHAIGLSEKLLPATQAPSDALWEKLVALADDPSIDVRYQLAFTLGETSHTARPALLARVLKGDLESKWVRAAVLSSLSNGASDVLLEFAKLNGKVSSPATRSFLRQLAQVIGAQKQHESITRELNEGHVLDMPLAFTMGSGLAEGAQRAGTLEEVRKQLNQLFTQARTQARNAGLDMEVRAAAIELLAYDTYEGASRVLFQILEEAPLQLHTLAALDRFQEREVAEQILLHWSKLRSRAQVEAIAILLKRPERAVILLQSIKSGAIKQSDLSAIQVNQLLASKDESIRTLAGKILSAPATQRAAVVESFQSSLSLTGDATRGRAIYQERCISCHRANGEGHAVGPDMVTVRNSGKEKLLINILDPSREVAANMIAFLVETKDGESLSGIIASDTTTSITIRQAYGKDTVLPRSKIKHMASQGKSLMPDGLEQGLDAQKFADLLEFVSTAKQ